MVYIDLAISYRQCDSNDRNDVIHCLSTNFRTITINFIEVKAKIKMDILKNSYSQKYSCMQTDQLNSNAMDVCHRFGMVPVQISSLQQMSKFFTIIPVQFALLLYRTTSVQQMSVWFQEAS